MSISPTEQVRQYILRDTEALKAKPLAKEYGEDWHFLMREEVVVFGLRLQDMPSLVALWSAYEAVKDICHNDLHRQKELVESFRTEQPWIAERLKYISVEEFQRFGKLFDYSYRKTDAWYWKFKFWNVRNGISRYKDEPKKDVDDEFPF